MTDREMITNGEATLRQFQDNIVLRMSNIGYTRHWIHWNYPEDQPWEMAVCFLSAAGEPALFRSLVKDYGAEERFEVSAVPIYIFRRVNDDGTPFTARRRLI